SPHRRSGMARQARAGGWEALSTARCNPVYAAVGGGWQAWSLCALMTFSGGRWPSGPYGGIVERDVLLTQEGYEKLQEELAQLSTDKRREVADRIRVAREFGDISENSEFDDAKNEQMLLEKQIAKLEERLRSARIIDPSDADAGAVNVGLQVTVKDIDRKRDATYRIVGSAEADPSAGRLSNESPVGRALMGRKKGETVEVSV